MEAPDKIYLERDYPDNGVLPVGLHYNPSQSDVQYIRKDLLLEWAKKELEMRRNTGDDYFYPALVVLNDLIEKLNSL